MYIYINNKDSEDEGMLINVMTVTNEIIQAIPLFLSPYIGDIIQANYFVHTSSVQKEVMVNHFPL